MEETIVSRSATSGSTPAADFFQSFREWEGVIGNQIPRPVSAHYAETRTDWIRVKARFETHVVFVLRTKTLGRKEPSMMIIGCDFHPSWQQVSWLDTETGDCGERKLVHANGDAKMFYEQLAAPVLIGMEATGNSQWFVELVEDVGHEIWIGDAAQIRASYVRKQKTDKRDAAHILKLVTQGRFPRLWTPDREQRDLRQLVLHRHKLVEIRSRVKNELQHLSMNKGVQRKHKLWSQAGQKMLRELALKPWASCRREDLLGLLSMLNQQIGQFDHAVQQAAEENPQARLLMTQPGVGPNTALAYVLTIGEVSRFPRGKQVASYLGLIPREESSGGRQKLGAITKQGNRMLRSLLVE